MDLKDKRILAELFNNSRQSFSSIGKSVSLPKGVVKFRYDKLKESKILDLCCTIINKKALGYNDVKIYTTI